jgi:diguanylate cyclase (GGDEF)-like protein/PAS domain S-box-containing protein
MPREARNLYLDAIAEAQTQDYALLAGHLYECLADLLKNTAMGDAEIYFAEARRLYRVCRADGKSARLQERHGLVPVDRALRRVETVAEMADEATESATTELATLPNLDISYLMKSSLALAAETDSAQLLQKIMAMVLESSGAQHGYLLIREQGALTVVAENHSGQQLIIQPLHGSLIKERGICQAIVNYVARTRKKVVLRNASAEGDFQNAPEVQTLGLRSVLCLPLIKQTALVGVLYLENRLAEGIFTPEKSGMTELLTSHAAISLENAHLLEEMRSAHYEKQKALDYLHEIASQVPGAVFQFEKYPDGKFCVPYASDGFREIFHVTPEEVREEASSMFVNIHADDLEGFKSSIQDSARNMSPWNFKFRVICSVESTHWFLVNAVPRREKDGTVLWHGIISDITSQQHAETELRIAATVFESQEGMLVTDADAIILRINNAFTHITGYTAEEAIGKNPRILKSGRHDKAFFASMWEGINNTGTWDGEIWNKRKNGEIYPQHLIITAVKSEYGEIVNYVATLTDITESKQHQNEVEQIAYYDQLTQLPNRRLFYDRLELEVRKAQREHCLIALLFIDLDRFKEVNDTLGHDFGDQLLIQTAARIRHCVRNSDTVARLGGDEFTVILSELEDISDSGRIALNIIERLSESFMLNGKEACVSASIGIAIYPNDAVNVLDLIRIADQAMYVAKGAGRGCFRYFTKAMQEESELRSRLGDDLHHAIEKGQFSVHYQPIVELDTGFIDKAEALLRWQHPELGTINPADFIPIAEGNGTIHDIGNWVFMQAARQIAHLMTLLGRDFQIAVNKSSVQFLVDGIDHNGWVERLGEIGLPGSSIMVEIAEDLLMGADIGVLNNLLSFRDAGIQVAIDDFGTGYSALPYLNKFDIDYLKIAPSLIRNLAPDTSEFFLCEAIVVTAHKLGLKVIAKGVETEQQRDLLKKIGCDYGQGYLFSRPLPSCEFEKLLTRH